MDEEIKKILEQQSQDLTDIKTSLAKIQRHFVWSRVWSIVRILLIVVPLVIGYIMVLPLLQQALSQYQDLTSALNSGSQPAANSDALQQLLNQYLQQRK